ncbi:DNA polymerase I [bioreactor metagenome]|uniref:DNA-directed DNA polymerase n=1 Tax=bioreactor metagenome TaxID=1076179 RepID=A0A644URV1_9ZZZZ
MPHTVVIIDGSSLIHRAFYALPLLTTASGQYTNAVYGFATMLIKLINDIKPDSIVVALDKGKVTFRTEKFSQYKANRKATPTELAEQFPLVKELLNAFNIAMIEQDGFEADDIIGTLAKKASDQKHEVIIVTGDRDALQLINPNTKVLLTKKGISEMELYSEKEFRAKYGVAPIQLIDLKGLMGDSSDNIPGVPGVGEKTAMKLIGEFGSVENVLDNIDNISGKKLQENIRNNVESAILSKQLATINCDMELDFTAEKFNLKPNRFKVEEFLLKFEFKSLLARMGSILTADSKQMSLPKPTPAILITTSEEIETIVDNIKQAGYLSFYPIFKGKVPSIIFEGMAVIYNDNPVYISAENPNWGHVLDVLGDHNVKKITYDSKVVYTACTKLGKTVAGSFFDTVLAAYLLDPTASEYQLPSLIAEYLGKPSNLAESSFETSADYAAWACQSVHELYDILDSKLNEKQLSKLYYEIELPLVEVLAATELTGIKVDTEHLSLMATEIAEKVAILLEDIYKLAGEQFNVNSTKQLGLVLFEKLNLPTMKKTKTGYSTDAEVLEKLMGFHPIIDKLLEYRQLTKLKSTYLDGLQPLINLESGRIHTHFNQTVTATGRLSSSEPNLQNIPIRTDIGRRIRELFIPGGEFTYIMSADYSQIELRVLAHMSGDHNLIDAFREEEDVHTRTAANVFGVPHEEVTPEMRSKAKAVNFGIVYGISDYGLSRDIGVNRKEAGQYIERYFEKYSGVKSFMNDVVADARKTGFVMTMLGRRRYLPDINSGNFNKRSFAERTAMNTPIQGTAADIIKKAMIDVYHELKAAKVKSRMLLQVHDELVLEVTYDEVEIVSEVVKRIMEQAVVLDVPLVADIKIGNNWAKAK